MPWRPRGPKLDILRHSSELNNKQCCIGKSYAKYMLELFILAFINVFVNN